MLAFRQPAEPLRAHVGGYWHLDAPTEAGHVERFLPGTRLTWIFVLGPAARYRLGQYEGTQPRAFANGILRGPCLVAARGVTRNIGVAFRAGAAALFHRLELGALEGELVDLEQVSDPGLEALARRLRGVEDFDGATMALDRFLLARLCGGTPGIGPRLAALIESGRVHDVGTLAERAGYSARQLRRICRRELGGSPKSLLRIARVRRAADVLRGTPEPVVRVAHRFGYFDQAHFVHDFRKVVGLSPSAFRHAERPLATLFE